MVSCANSGPDNGLRSVCELAAAFITLGCSFKVFTRLGHAIHGIPRGYMYFIPKENERKWLLSEGIKRSSEIIN